MDSLNPILRRLAVSFLLLYGTALAQTSTTSLQGTVTDPTGAAVANATVELVNVDSKTQRDANTDAQGEYRFQFLPPGTYTLTVGAAGFAPRARWLPCIALENAGEVCLRLEPDR